MLRDDSFPVMISPALREHSNSPPPQRLHTNNDFDDIFGSAPPSPSLSTTQPSNNTEPSEVPRLRSSHSTAGYREGLASSKSRTIQAGFDEGFSLGATMGLRVGQVLGILEGILGALNNSVTFTEDQVRVKKLVDEAREELKTEHVFGKEWWGADGVWIYEVPGEHQEGKIVTWNEVVDAHPLVGRWENVVRDEVEKWGIDLDIMEEEEANEGSATKIEKKITAVPKEQEADGDEGKIAVKTAIDW